MEKTAALYVEISKEFDVSPDRLYQAWTSENDLKQWWHPMNNRLKHLKNELRPGGVVMYTFESNEGKEVFNIEGTYKEVDPGKKLIYTWNWHLPTPTVHDSDFILSVFFEPTGSGSLLRVRQEQFAHEESLQPHHEGWDKALNDLQTYLGKQ